MASTAYRGGVLIHVGARGVRWCKVGDVWTAAKEWGKRNGKVVEPGVVQGAPPL